MAANNLETVGDNATLGYSLAGTLSGGTLSGGTLTAGVLGGSVVAVSTITPFASIYDITPNETEVTEVPTTKLASLADESQPGTPNYNEVQLTIPYTYSITSLVNGWIDNKTVLFFKATVDDFTSTDSAESFLGWIKKYTPLSKELKKDEIAKAQITIRITGKPLMATGT